MITQRTILRAASLPEGVFELGPAVTPGSPLWPGADGGATVPQPGGSAEGGGGGGVRRSRSTDGARPRSASKVLIAWSEVPMPVPGPVTASKTGDGRRGRRGRG